jgi:hypothetical protein
VLLGDATVSQHFSFAKGPDSALSSFLDGSLEVDVWQ